MPLRRAQNKAKTSHEHRPRYTINGIPRHRRRGSQDQLRGRREFLTKEAVHDAFLCLQRTVIWIRSAPGAGRFAVGDDPRRLLARENHQSFNTNLVANMLTVTDLAYKPLFLSHPAPPDYDVIVGQTENACQ